MRKLLLAVMLILTSGICKADLIREFKLEGFDTFNGTLSGYLWMNVETGMSGILGLSYTYYGEYNQYPYGVRVANDGFFQVGGPWDGLSHPNEHVISLPFTGYSPNEPYLFFRMGTPGTLVDYHGDLCWNGDYRFHGCSGDNYVYITYALNLPAVKFGDHDIPAMYSGGIDYYFGSARFEQIGEGYSPEPSTFVLLGTGALGAIGAVRRRRKLQEN